MPTSHAPDCLICHHYGPREEPTPTLEDTACPECNHAACPINGAPSRPDGGLT